MSELKTRLKVNLKEAIRSGQQDVVSTLRFLQAAILNKEKEGRAKLAREHSDWPPEKLEKESALEDEEVLEVLSSEAKKRKEAIEAFVAGGRSDLAEKEKRELEIIQEYLPEQFSEEEVKGLAREAIRKTGAAGPRDMGKVMAELMPKIKGRAGGDVVGKIVRRLLINE